MSLSISRRYLCCGVLSTIVCMVLPVRQLHSQGRPFCRFSIESGWTDTGPSEFITRRTRQNDVSGVPQVVDKIKGGLNIDVDFDIYIAEQEDNAFATVANGRKLLIVDIGFLEKMNRGAGTQWAAIQVISHEIGHHIAGFSNDHHRCELNADYWSGQSLQRLGSSRVAATRGILRFGTDFDTPSHPNRMRRAAVIERGWVDAREGRIDYSFCDDCE